MKLWQISNFRMKTERWAGVWLWNCGISDEADGVRGQWRWDRGGSASITEIRQSYYPLFADRLEQGPYIGVLPCMTETIHMGTSDPFHQWQPRHRQRLDIRLQWRSHQSREPLTKIQSVSVLTEHTRAPACSSHWPLILVAASHQATLSDNSSNLSIVCCNFAKWRPEVVVKTQRREEWDPGQESVRDWAWAELEQAGPRLVPSVATVLEGGGWTELSTRHCPAWPGQARCGPRRSLAQDTDAHWPRSAQVCPTRTKKCSAPRQQRMTGWQLVRELTPGPKRAVRRRRCAETRGRKVKRTRCLTRCPDTLRGPRKNKQKTSRSKIDQSHTITVSNSQTSEIIITHFSQNSTLLRDKSQILSLSSWGKKFLNLVCSSRLQAEGRKLHKTPINSVIWMEEFSNKILINTPPTTNSSSLDKAISVPSTLDTTM